MRGPRQSGKSTLCRRTFPKHAYANLEAPDVRAFAQEDPRAFLGQFQGGAIIDEVQRCPEITSYLQERIDADPKPGKWILTGSQNLALIESVSQSLAGRARVLHLLPCGIGNSNDPGNISLMDWQPDGAGDISDAVAMLTFLFLGGHSHALAIPGAETKSCVPIVGCPERCGP